MIIISDQNIDLGEIHYAPDQSSKTRVITLTNNNDYSIRLHIEHFKNPSPDSPVCITLHEVDDELIKDTKALNRYFDTLGSLFEKQHDENIQYIMMNANETKYVVTVLSPIFFNLDKANLNNNRQDYARTSFFKVKNKLVLHCEKYNSTLSIYEFIDKNEINVSATLCTSILYVDETDIEFDSCIVGEMYVRDIQVWNRSECPLAFKITPVHDILIDSHQILSFQEFDNGRIIPFDKVIYIPAFASKRLRVVFRAKELGVLKITLRLENINNPTNNALLTCRINVIDVTENDSLILELESGLIVGTGQTLELGDCYCGLTVKRRLWVKNISKDIIILDITSDNPNDIRLDFTGHSADVDPESIKSNLIFNERSSINNAIKEDFDHENNFITDYNGNIFKTKHRHELELKDGENGIFETDERAEYISKFSKQNSQISKKLKEAYITAQGSAINSKNDVWGERNNRTILSLVPNYGKSDYNSDEEVEGFNEHKRFFIDSPKSAKYEESATSEDKQLQETISNTGSDLRTRNGRSKAHDQEVSNVSLSVPPGDSKPITLFYSPTYSMPRDEDAHIRDSKRQKNDLSNAGSLISKSIKLFLSWKINSIDNERDAESGGIVLKNEGQKAFKVIPEANSRLILCKARTCLSLVGVMPNVIDLGECSVGDYRTSTFTVVNDSDLSALMFPYVESETLSVTDSEIRIPPRERKQIQLEYVARVENTDYNKKVTLLNAYNPNSNVSFEVRAKNVDTHKVLLHSQFYKLNTHNSKRQLQLYFDTCLTNMQNLRTFSIKNVHSDTLKLELLAFGYDEHVDIRIFLIAPMAKYNSNESGPNSNSSGEQLSKRIEDLKWGSPFVPQVVKRSGSFGQEDDMLITSINGNQTGSSLSKVGSENNNDNTNEHFESQSIKRSGSETILNVTMPKHKILGKEKDFVPHKMDLITQVDKWGFPFSLITTNVEASKTSESASVIDSATAAASVTSSNSSALQVADLSLPLVDANEIETVSIATIQTLYREIKDLVDKEEIMIPLREDSHNGAVSIPPGITYNFAVVFEPKSRGTVDELESVAIHREIQIKLLSHANDLAIKTVDNEPIKPRILPMRAKVVRSEMTVLQKNISFGKTIVGELSTRGVTIVNKSSVPCIYSISKSGSISSGFLKILSGRKGVVEPMSSHTLEFAFKPTLAGSFEEIVHIENVLHPDNVQSIVVKAKVSKPESFQLLPSNEPPLITALFPELLNSESEYVDLTQKLKNDLQEELNKSESTEGKSSNATFLGDVAVGESCDVLISFRIRNVTHKPRQFIVDASHSDAFSLLFSESLTSVSNIGKMSDKTKINVPFEPIPDTLQSIVHLSCRFLEAAGDVVQPKLSVQETERIALEDKLEHFQQKLKIAYRKNKPDKIAKYEKKVKDAMAMLSGEITGPDNIGEEDDSGNETEKKSKKVETKESTEDIKVDDTVNSPSKTKTGKEIFGESDMAFHISIPAEQEALIQVKVTFLPGNSYRHWVGPLPFKGYFRVFECRNEDLVKKVPFGAMLFPSKHALSESLTPLVGNMSGETCTFFSNGADKVTNANSISLISNETTANTNLRMNQNTFLTTVAQWSSFPTKQMFPRYRQLQVNVLGMSIKLVQASKEKIMQGSVSIASLIREEASILLSIVHEIQFPVETNVDYKLYNPSEHGVMRVSHSIESTGQGEIEDLIESDGRWRSKINPGGKLEINVQWQPPSEMAQRVMIMSVLAVQMEVVGRRIGHIQYIPIICFLEYKSNFKVDKNLFFGEVPLGSLLTESVTITNLSSTEELHYITTLASTTPSARTIGNIEISTGQTGVLGALSSKEIRVSFNATSVGKFEQELWIWNLRDQFDQKRVVLSSTVIVPQSQFVVFPDVETDLVTGKMKRLELGLIQIQSNHLSDNLSSNSFDYVYKLCINNVSDKALAVTALSNLRSQCFIFTDSKCIHPVVSMPMPPLLETILYVVIRPSSLTSDQSYGRELIGGIRLVFFSMCEDSNNISSVEEANTEKLARKLFETTVVFRAIVGCSILRIRSSDTKSHLIATGNSEISNIKIKTLGTIMLENLSPTFTLNYVHMTVNCDYVSNESEVLNNWRKKKSQLIIFDNAEQGILGPLESKEIKYGIAFDSSISGFMKYSVKVLNSNTGDTQTFSNAIFFDNGAISTITDTINENKELVSFIGGLKPIYVYRISSALLAPGRRSSSPASAETLLVTGSDGLILLQYMIENETSNSLTISPFSDVPISIAIDLINEQVSNSIQSNATLKRESNKSYNSLLSISSGTMNMGNFRKCGETAVIPPGEKANIIISCNKGAEIPDDLVSNLMTQLESVGIARVKGAIAFVSSHQMVSSIFDTNRLNTSKASVPMLTNLFEPPSDFDLELPVTEPPIALDSELPKIEHFPFLHYCELECGFVVPRLMIPSKNINLGKLRDGRQFSYKFPIYNSCEVSVTIGIENLPSWLSIGDQTMVVPPKDTLLVQMNVELLLSESTLLEESFFIRNLALSSEGFSEFLGEDLIAINIRAEVDATDILGLTANGSVCQKLSNGCHIIDIADVLTIPPTALTTASASRIYIRNNMNVSMKLTSNFNLNPIFDNLIELDILLQNNSIIGQPIDLIAGETIECKITCRAFAGTRMSSLINNDSNDFDDNKPGQRQFDVLFGTLQFFSSFDNGLQITKDKPVSPSSKSKILDSDALFMDIEMVAASDVADLSIDIFGHLEHGATTLLSSFLDSDCKTDKIAFKATKSSSSKQVDESENINEEAWSPQLRLEDHNFKVQLSNPSATETIAFRLSSSAYRHAGMRLSFQRMDNGSYDTVIARAYPCSGMIPPLTEITLSIRLEPCNSQETATTISCRQDRDRDLFGFMAVMRILLEIIDENYPTHPPLALHVLLLSDVILPVIVAQPVSDTNRKKLHLDTYHDGRERLRGKGEKETEEIINRSSSPWERTSVDKDIASTSEGREITSLPTIRLRGVTPCLPMKGQFEICLGQHIQRSESIEWLMTLENCSSSMGMRFNISTLSESDERWLLIGQTRGSIQTGGSISITLYFSRLHLGMFFTYLILENLTNPSDLHIIRVSMEVVNDSRDKQLFAVQTCVNGHQPNQVTRKGELVNDFQQIHYGDIYIGRQYRRRFIILINLSDTLSLDFQLSSTLPNVMTFTLSPLSLKPCTMVTLAPLERRQVFIVFRPFVPLLYNLLYASTDNATSVDISTKKFEVEQSFSNKQIKGEIGISCRLVKDHQETIKIYGVYKFPLLKVSLEHPQKTIETFGVDSISDHFIQLSNETNVEVADGVESVINLGTGASNRLDKSTRWSHSQHVCIKNNYHTEKIISIFSIMQYFTLQVDEVLTKDMENVTKAAINERNDVKLWDDDWMFNSIRTASAANPQRARMIQHITVPGNGTVLLSLHSNIESSTTKNKKDDDEEHDSMEAFNEIKYKIQCLKDNAGEEGEAFLIYMRHCPTEKYRISVRIDPHVDIETATDPIISSKLLSLSSSHIMNSTKVANPVNSLKHSQVSTVAPLEAAISLYLKQFNAIWSANFEIDATLQDGVSFKMDIDNNSDIKSILKDVGNQGMKILEDGIFIEQNATVPLSINRKRAVALTESFFSFVAITDQLIVQRCHLSNNSSTASTINQPSTSLAQLFYLMIFRHPVFEAAVDIKKGKESVEGNDDIINRGYELLSPFYTQFSQYMLAFPDMNPDDPLVRLWTSMRN